MLCPEAAAAADRRDAGGVTGEAGRVAIRVLRYAVSTRMRVGILFRVALNHEGQICERELDRGAARV